MIKEGSPIAAYKYTNFDDPTNTVKTKLPKLPFKGLLNGFSVCKLANDTKVILSGGWSQDWPSAKVHALDTSMWKWKQLPDLNIARSAHSSTSLGEAVYVACGRDYYRTLLNSVERLLLGRSGCA